MLRRQRQAGRRLHLRRHPGEPGRPVFGRAHRGKRRPQLPGQHPRGAAEPGGGLVHLLPQADQPPFLLPAGLRGEAGAHPRRRLPAGGGDLLRAERRGAAGRGPVRGPDRLQFVEQGRRGAVRRPQPPQKAEGAPLFHPIRRPEGGVRPVHRQYAGRRGGGVQVFPHGNAGLHPGGNQRGGPGDHGGLRHAGLCPPLRGAENRPRDGPGAAAGHRARRAAAVLPLPRGGQREFSRLHPSDGIMGEAAQAVKNRRDSFEKLYQ